MKFKLVVGIFVAAFVAFAAGTWSPMHSEAAVEDLSYTQSCQPDGNLNVSFSWTGAPIGVVQQWVDLSLSDNGWQGGTFIGNGPLAGSAHDVTWPGLKQNATHYVRVNQLMQDGSWVASPTFYFTTPFCASNGAQVNVGPGGGSINLNDIDRKQVDAPIHDAQVVSNGQGGFVVKAQVGLPSGCAKAGGSQMTQQDNVITVHVFDTIPTVAIPCTPPPADYSLTVDLPALTPGKPYEIHVNDKVLSFVIP